MSLEYLMKQIKLAMCAVIIDISRHTRAFDNLGT